MCAPRLAPKTISALQLSVAAARSRPYCAHRPTMSSNSDSAGASASAPAAASSPAPAPAALTTLKFAPCGDTYVRMHAVVPAPPPALLAVCATLGIDLPRLRGAGATSTAKALAGLSVQLAQFEISVLRKDLCSPAHYVARNGKEKSLSTSGSRKDIIPRVLAWVQRYLDPPSAPAPPPNTPTRRRGGKAPAAGATMGRQNVAGRRTAANIAPAGVRAALPIAPRGKEGVPPAPAPSPLLGAVGPVAAGGSGVLVAEAAAAAAAAAEAETTLAEALGEAVPGDGMLPGAANGGGEAGVKREAEPEVKKAPMKRRKKVTPPRGGDGVDGEPAGMGEAAVEDDDPDEDDDEAVADAAQRRQEFAMRKAEHDVAMRTARCAALQKVVALEDECYRMIVDAERVVNEAGESATPTMRARVKNLYVKLETVQGMLRE